jgi:hypothetical protein
MDLVLYLYGMVSWLIKATTRQQPMGPDTAKAYISQFSQKKWIFQ